MNLLAKAKRYAAKYGGISGAAAKLGIPRSTLRGWLAKEASKRSKTPPQSKPVEPASAVIRGEWSQSLLYDSAHYLIEGQPACAGTPSGARPLHASAWFTHDGNLRRCFRCLHVARQMETKEGKR